MRIISLLLVFMFFLSSGLLAEIRITPVVNISLTGGQYFLKTEATSFGGNFNLFFTPVINFTPRTALLPMFSLTYRGTKDVQELVGGGTLTQEYIDIGPITLKFIHRFSNTFKLKPRISYKIKYLKETKDETWQKGLFDYRRATAGIELEKMFVGEEISTNLRLGYDFYSMRYPNYSSLIFQEQFKVSLDTTTYKELSTNAGVNVLDYNTHQLYTEIIRPLSEVVTGKISYNIVLKNFVDQRIVNETGQFTTDLRSDISHLLFLGISLKTYRAAIYLNNTLQYYGSNQNSYDAGRTYFIPKFYNFFQNTLSSTIHFYLGRVQPYIKFSLYFDLSYRQYSDRLTQNERGEYLQEKISQNINSVGLNFTYPISLLQGLSVKFNTNYRVSNSNMKFEKYYKYNYYVANYFVGLEWKY